MTTFLVLLKIWFVNNASDDTAIDTNKICLSFVTSEGNVVRNCLHLLDDFRTIYPFCVQICILNCV